MSFKLVNFGRGTMNCNILGPTQHMYNAKLDAVATVEAVGYFNDAADLMLVNDIIFAVMNDNADIGFYQVTDITDGVVTTMAFDTDVGAGAIGTANLANDAVTTAKIDDDAVTTAKIADENVTSDKLAPMLIKHARVLATAVQVDGMYVAPIELVGAPAITEKLVLHGIKIDEDYGGTVFANGGAIHVQYDDTTLGAGPKATDTYAAATFIGQVADCSFGLTPVQTALADATTLGQGLFLSNATGAFTGGTGSAFIIDVWYSIVDYA